MVILTYEAFANEIMKERPTDLTLPVYTKNQANQGSILYQQNCATCHGDKLNNGSFAPPLIGSAFYSKWGGHTVGELLTYVERLMPPGAGGVLSTKQYVDTLAYIFQYGGIPVGSEVMPVEVGKLYEQFLPIPVGGVIPEEKIEVPPPPNVRANPLDNISAVTDKMLINPHAGDWLMWRRTYDAKGFSPLKKITADNVKNLRVAWAWSMPSGRNITTPLVHDGVMFMC